MEYEFYGQRTGKVYARGRKNDCFRKLQKEYPTTYDSKKAGGPKVRIVYPEPILFKGVSNTFDSLEQK